MMLCVLGQGGGTGGFDDGGNKADIPATGPTDKTDGEDINYTLLHPGWDHLHNLALLTIGLLGRAPLHRRNTTRQPSALLSEVVEGMLRQR